MQGLLPLYSLEFLTILLSQSPQVNMVISFMDLQHRNELVRSCCRILSEICEEKLKGHKRIHT